MSDRGLMFPIIGAVTTTAILILYRIGTGHFPNPIVFASLYLVGVGIGLIHARLGRLGPFDGQLGSPWFESDLHEALTREDARSLRFQRPLTIAVIRPKRGAGVEWSDYLRLADQAFTCRNGWSILILAETPPESATKLVERVEAEIGSELHAALLMPDPKLPIVKQIERDILSSLTDPSITAGACSRDVRRGFEPARS